jgi:hypothetical protein
MSAERAGAALNLVCKWRTVLTGWQLGSRPKGDPECDAVSDHREATIALRVEVAALTSVLIESGVISREQWQDALEVESLTLAEAYATRFPGFRAVPDGMAIDPALAAETMRGWKP